MQTWLYAINWFCQISNSIYRQVNISESGSISRFIDSAILGVWPIALRLFIVHVIITNVIYSCVISSFCIYLLPVGCILIKLGCTYVTLSITVDRLCVTFSDFRSESYNWSYNCVNKDKNEWITILIFRIKVVCAQ